MDMKKYIVSLSLFSAVFASCGNPDFVPAEYNVRLDQGNTYRVGEPVVFDIIGNVDNLLFYSGEVGHEYKHFNRYEVDPADIRKAAFEMDIQFLYGGTPGPGALDIYISRTFDGLSGEDAEADRAAIRRMVDGGMEGWVKYDYQEGTTRVYERHDIDLKEYVDNCSIAMHWHPQRVDPATSGAIPQRTFWINANLVTDFGYGSNSINIRNIEWVTVMMNSYYDANPYIHSQANGNGYINFNKSGSDLILQGVGATDFDFDIDGWLFSAPMPLTAVENDQPLVIKDMANYMTSYEYTWNEPGTYLVSFVGINTNYAGESQLVKEFKITII